MNNIFRKFKSCSGFPSSRNPDLGSGSLSTASRRHLLSVRSLTRGPSLNGISPVPSSADGGFSDPVEPVKTVLDQLGTLIDRQGEPVNNRSVTSRQLKNVQIYCENHVHPLGQVFEKLGGGANGQMPSVAGNANGNDGFQFEELRTILRDVGQLHWVGSVLVVLAIVLDRWQKASERPEKLLAHMKKLKRFGKHVLKLHRQEQDFRSSEPSESVQEALRIILKHDAYCRRGIGKTSCFKRFMFADSDHKELVRLEAEIVQLYPELNFDAQLILIDMHKERTGVPSGTSDKSERTVETFELIEDTVMVGDERRVVEARQKLENDDTATGVSALILWGMLGSGKSTVGLKLARELKRERNIDKLQCCKILMRGDPDSAIEVKAKQEELYKKLSMKKRGDEKKFYDCQEGRRELRDLFASLPRDEPLLLLFDDANSIHDFQELLPGNLDKALPPGSILLVTTTVCGIIDKLEDKGVYCRSYEVNLLEKEEAEALFLKKIFGDHDASHDSAVKGHLMQSEPFRKLLNFCDGVPLAINVVGSFIWHRGKQYLRGCFKSLPNPVDIEAAYWKLDPDGRKTFLKKLTESVTHAYNQLSGGDPINNDRSPLDRSLDFAYGQLNSIPRIRERFLDIVAVHLGRLWNDVELVCGAEDLATLKQLSMVKRLVYNDGTSGAIVQVHNLLVGMSRRLENCESKGRRVVVETVNELPECFRNERGSDVCNRVELVKLGHCKVLTAGQLDLLTCNMRYLEMHGTKIVGICTTVPPNLTYFRSRQSSLPFPLHELRNLVVLDVDFRWEAASESQVLELMPKLQKLKVENSCSLKGLGPGLRKLRTVEIVNCPNFERIGSLDSATVEELGVVNCPKFRDFSNVTKLERLERLSLAGFECHPPSLPAQELTRFPKVILPRVQILNLSRISDLKELPTFSQDNRTKLPAQELTRFPKELVIPPSVQTLNLSRNSNLKELPTFSQDNRIKKLNLRSCSALKQLDGMGLLTSLECLELGGCSGLERVPSLPGHHPKLKVLDVQGCGELHRSELQESVEVIRARNPDFRLIGLRLTDGNEGPRGCAALQQCVQLSYKKTCSLFEKMVPRRLLKTSSTFPSRSKSKY